MAKAQSDTRSRGETGASFGNRRHAVPRSRLWAGP